MTGNETKISGRWPLKFSRSGPTRDALIEDRPNRLVVCHHDLARKPVARVRRNWNTVRRPARKLGDGGAVRITVDPRVKFPRHPVLVPQLIVPGVDVTRLNASFARSPTL